VIYLLASTKVTFKSETGDLPDGLEVQLADLTRTIEYRAKQIAETYRIAYEVEEE
jgi:hypothetical protein